MNEKEEIQYYDVLYDFTSVIVRLNDSAFDGEPSKNIAKRIYKLIPAFTALCGVDADITEPLQDQSEKKTEPKPADPEPLPDNFMKEDNGWGLCPVCRRKIIKVTSTTKLIDFPAYCKSCKTEYLVSWWNVENKDISYTRYVNNKSYINRRDIRNEGLKGTGVQNFMRTRTSSTERVAMHL